MDSQKEAVNSEELFSVGRRIRKMKHLLWFFFVLYQFVEGLKDGTLVCAYDRLSDICYL